jgi:hypothetical protein
LIATGKYRLVKSTDLTPQQISAGLTPLEVFSKKLAKTDLSLYLKYNTLMFKVQVIMVYKLVRECSSRFCWTFWIYWTCFADGNNFNLPTPKIVNAFEAGDSRKAVTILDMVAWIAQNPGTSYKNKIRTQVISTENTYQEREDLKQLEMLN